MEKEYFDRIMRLLVEKDPQVLVAFLLKDAIYEGELDRELALQTYGRELSPELQERILNADKLYQVQWNDEHIVLHLEFQRFGESEVPRKIWECNALTSIITGKLVHSMVIYGMPVPSIPEPVYEIRLPDGQVSHSFSFEQIKLWEIEPDVFAPPRFSWLLPPHILEESWVYQEILQKGRQQGLLHFVERRFPSLLALAKPVIEREMSLQQFEALADKLYLADTIEEAGAALQSAYDIKQSD